MGICHVLLTVISLSLRSVRLLEWEVTSQSLCVCVCEREREREREREGERERSLSLTAGNTRNPISFEMNTHTQFKSSHTLAVGMGSHVTGVGVCEREKEREGGVFKSHRRKHTGSPISFEVTTHTHTHTHTQRHRVPVFLLFCFFSAPRL